MRVLSAFLAFVLLVGSGSLWLLYNIAKRKKSLKNLLSLPKERRFFWYKARQAGFRVLSHYLLKNFPVAINSYPKNFSICADFLFERSGKKYAGIFVPSFDERECLKLFFIYQAFFRVRGVIFYDEVVRKLEVWED
jgi:hypothetical protein